jgi:hypothetical protein
MCQHKVLVLLELLVLLVLLELLELLVLLVLLVLPNQLFLDSPIMPALFPLHEPFLIMIREFALVFVTQRFHSRSLPNFQLLLAWNHP